MNYEKINAMAREAFGMPKTRVYTVQLRYRREWSITVDLALQDSKNLERLAAEKAVSLCPETKVEDYQLESVRC